METMEKNSIREWFYKKYSRKDDTESSVKYNENLQNELLLANEDNLKQDYLEYWDKLYNKRVELLNKTFKEKFRFSTPDEE